MLNKVILMGRLCADPEIKTTKSGISICRICVAVNRQYKSNTGEKQTDFINVTCWRQTADFVSKYFCKGSMIIVEGSLQNNDYTDQNGVKHYSMIVSAEKADFGESKNSSQTAQNASQNAQPYQTQNYTPNNQNAYVGQNTAYQGYSQTRDTYANQQSLNGYSENCLSKPDLSEFEEILSDGNPPF